MTNTMLNELRMEEADLINRIAELEAEEEQLKQQRGDYKPQDKKDLEAQP